MAATKDLIFILGMGRSGTSALTRVLALCGARLPDDLLGANIGNQRGHFEPLEALALNDAFLARFGLTWFDPTLRLDGDIVVPPAVRDAFVDEIALFLRRNDGRSPLVVKDPRIAGLTDPWFEAARREGWTIKVVIPVRHPIEVAQSLAKRNAIGPDLSLALWLKYTLLAEQASRRLPRVFVGYGALLADWKSEVRRIARALDVRLALRRTRAIGAFLGRDLHHHRVDDAKPVANVWVRQLYEQLVAACRDVAPDTAALDRLRLSYADAEGLLRRATADHARCGPPVTLQPPPPPVQPPLPPILHRLITEFNETGYLENNSDVREAVEDGRHTSGLEHWLVFGHAEGRRSN